MSRWDKNGTGGVREVSKADDDGYDDEADKLDRTGNDDSLLQEGGTNGLEGWNVGADIVRRGEKAGSLTGHGLDWTPCHSSGRSRAPATARGTSGSSPSPTGQQLAKL